MPDRDEEDVPASLALPKLSLRRSRRGKSAPPSELSRAPSARPEAPPETPPEAVAEPVAPEPVTSEPDVPVPEPAPGPVDVEPTVELVPAAGALTEQLPRAVDVPEPAPVVESEPEPAAPAAERTPREPLRLPEVGPWPVVLVTGLLVGAVLVGLTWGSLRACEAVQGTATCGKTGYPLVGLILVLAVVAGALLLRLGGVPDPVSTSILGVGLTAVIVLLFLVGHLDHPAAAVAVVLIDVATFAAAHGLTTRVVEPARD